MKKEMVIDVLKEQGFNAKESLVYLAALQSPDSPASAIAEHAGLNRVTTYGILQDLSTTGVVSMREGRNGKYFTACLPDQLFEYRRSALQSFETALPDMMAMAGLKESFPQVRFLEGVEGVKKGYLETLNAQTQILSYANSDNIRKHWKEYDDEYVSVRAKKKIFLRGLAIDDEEGKKVQSADSMYCRKTKLIPQSSFPNEYMENEINIFDTKVIIASFSPDPFAIIIDSSTVAQTHRSLFEILWRFI